MSGKLPKISELPFRAEVESRGGKIYAVGGSVRDYFLGIESKDLDVLITGIPMEHLQIILGCFGRVDSVGKSFGVLKFKNDYIKEIDVTIPRTERPNGKGGYQGFDVVADHELPLEKDLVRRDFTINAMARDVEGNLIDPFDGISDIRAMQIRMVNKDAFNDDPLRMLRAIQFASRFNFQIETKTAVSIMNNGKRIQEISPERILIELEKIVKRGNCSLGNSLLISSGLLNHITKEDRRFSNLLSQDQWNQISTFGEFLFALLYQKMDNPADFFKDELKGDLDTYREIKAYEIAYTGYSKDIPYKNRIFQMHKLSANSINSKMLPEEIQLEVLYMKAKNLPFCVKDLKINGDDLLQLGYVGKEIGDMISAMMDGVYMETLSNNREKLLEFATLSKKGVEIGNNLP
jgi:tRNA nucleotidyltransferase/poly(A) polymerase